ncbi:FG-GAP-like repeat-containing protein [Thalassobellus citreus]|uniref:FG-GAP-like repeat-containing protein n=1 Tax=Thalassobellus citreus TaxID=3367752 RepID=UPI0037AC1517
MKVRFFYLFIFFLSFKVFAQIGFQDHIIIDNSFAADAPMSVYAADIDGDGDMDMISASFNDSKIAWYENIDGLGSFSLPKTISLIANGALVVFASDFDGDGDMDVLSASSSDNKIAWYENTDGLGDFGAQQIISSTAYAVNSVFASDLDGDGDKDVLSATLGDNKIAWYENTDGLGNFGAQQIIISTAYGAKSVFASDLDGDGDMDVLSASSNDNKIAWYENTNGLGSFGLQKTINTNSKGANSVIASDLDGDGDMDVISSSDSINSNDEIIWYKNIDGFGLFEIQQTVLTNTKRPLSIFAVDIDNDGDNDLLSATSWGGAIAWYENIDSLGGFGTEQIISFDSANSVFASDIDNDGDMDLVSASSSDDKVAWFKNTNGLGDFVIQQILTQNADEPSSVLSYDIDGDGDLDVVSASIIDDKIAWYENTDGLGNFGTQKIITSSANGPSSINVSDIDGDGDMDVISATIYTNEIAWYENTDGLGNFSSKKTITTNVYTPQSVCTSDLDNDGDLDVIYASFGDSKIAWHENTDGLGNFSAQKIITTSAIQVISIFLVDIDGDNDVDVISASAGNGTIAWHENIDGLGNFSNQKNVFTDGFDAYSIYASDLDGDGDNDIIASISYDYKIVWFENTNGQGNFGTSQLITSEVDGAPKVYAIDLDSDGDMDILSASLNDNKIAWYENLNTKGEFGPQQIITTNANGARFVYAADIDGDQDIDVLSASKNDSKIAWYENTSTLSTNENILLNFYVFPNPTKGIFNIKSRSTVFKLDIYNMFGQFISTSYNKNTIDIRHLNSGLYLVKIIDKMGEHGIIKIIKI